MRVLLDTHAFLWLVTDDPRVSQAAREIFLDAENVIFLSGVSGLEIAVKYSLGKLKLAAPPREFIEARIANNDLLPLPVALAHTYRLAHLPFHHRDPFDRLLVSQAMEEDLPIVTSDAALGAYDVETMW
ncbi:MAG: type II toxin-antitoxin system VapC family toxin [Gammaproteobacteria bacterium]|nr:type II toxin-antitoxin system VapC family toxin [Gammaproteobacteria bacterium]